MTPTLRGENGNPGNFECFYGEVDDVIAAGRYLATLPYVDPKHISSRATAPAARSRS
jgi:dipeptidyl aminopeptidase/acylaminoacyl peptidase